VIRIAISQAAFDAIASTLPPGSTGYENAVNEKGERLIWLERRMLDKLNSYRRLARATPTSSSGWRRRASGQGRARRSDRPQPPATSLSPTRSPGSPPMVRLRAN
jgi:hypothetical protein